MPLFLKISWLIISWVASTLSMIGAYQVLWFVYVKFYGPPGSTFWGLTVQYFWILTSILPVFLLPEYLELKMPRRPMLLLRIIPCVVFFAAIVFELETYPYRSLILIAMSLCFWWVFLISTGIGSINLRSLSTIFWEKISSNK